MGLGLRLPGSVEWLLNEMNYFWPEVDEVELFELGVHWVAYGAKLATVSSNAQTAANEVWASNQGPAVTAFKDRWEHQQSPAAVLKAYAMGAVLAVCAAAVLFLKINVIIQLFTLLAAILEAIALGPATLGLSTLQIPVAKEIIGRLVGLLINMTIEALLG
jgi:hypothetical protein